MPDVRRALLPYAGAALIIAADQASKAWIVSALGNGQPPIVVVPNVLYLLFRRNTGMAFSLLVDFPWLLTLVALVASIVLGVVLWRQRRGPLLARLALMLLLGGAVGNLIDRLRDGSVIDFVYFAPINFPAFNVADSALTFGVILAVWAMSFGANPPATAAEPLLDEAP